MRLSELLRSAGLPHVSVPNNDRGAAVVDEQVRGIAVDSSKVDRGFIFAALPGHRTHGARFIEQALASGAIAVLTDPVGARMVVGTKGSHVPMVVVDDPRAAVAQLACVLWNFPARALSMIGVTGTNGKTTVTHLVQAALSKADIPCGIIGTLGASLPGRLDIAQSRTTPEAPDLQHMLSLMVDNGARAVSMEVSSIALREHRVDGVMFDVAAFTGLTQDHLDYHGSMHEYFRAKADLFTHERARRAVIVVDDTYGRALAQDTGIPVTTVSRLDRAADWFVTHVGNRVTISGVEEAQIDMSVPTDFSMANVALSVAIGSELGVGAQAAADAAVSARVPGRMEVVARVGDIDFVVDYAHTPDAIQRVLSSAVQSRRPLDGRVIVVLGAGGDRDVSKRREMGRAASGGSDVLFVTDDNPRSEDPAVIRAALIGGARGGDCQVFEVASRHEAIGRAVEEARAHDVVLVLGKGHESTQEIAGHVLPFDDRIVLASFVRDRFGPDEEGGLR